MSIYITGDVHGDFSELQQWCCAMESKKSDIIVILGDVALNYFGGWKDYKRKKKANALGPEIFTFMEIMRCGQKMPDASKYVLSKSRTASGK